MLGTLTLALLLALPATTTLAMVIKPPAPKNTSIAPVAPKTKQPTKYGSFFRPGGRSRPQSSSTPAVSVAEPMGASVVRHRVQKGDSLAKISGLYYSSQAYSERLQRFNQLAPYSLLQLEQIILVPSLEVLLMATPARVEVENNPLFVKLFGKQKFSVDAAICLRITTGNKPTIAALKAHLGPEKTAILFDQGGLSAELEKFDFTNYDLVLLLLPGHRTAGVSHPYTMIYQDRRNQTKSYDIHLELAGRAHKVTGRALWVPKDRAARILFHRRQQVTEIPIALIEAGP